MLVGMSMLRSCLEHTDVEVGKPRSEHVYLL